MLSPRRLAVLREFAGRGTIAAAAEALAFTPSAVSQQLAQLQREAGVELFRKVGRRLELTDAGRTLAVRAGELLARVEEIEAELAAQSADVRGTVRVAAFQTAAQALAVPALDRLAAAHPRLRVELAEVEAEESLPLLARGGLDVAIAEEYEHAPRPRLPRLHRVELEPDELLLALPRDHPALAGDGPVALAAPARPPPGRAGGPAPPTRTCSPASAAPPASSPTCPTASTTCGCCSTSSPPAGRPRWCRRSAGPSATSAWRSAASPRAATSRALFAAVRASDRARPATAAVVDALRRAAAA